MTKVRSVPCPASAAATSSIYRPTPARSAVATVVSMMTRSGAESNETEFTPHFSFVFGLYQLSGLKAIALERLARYVEALIGQSSWTGKPATLTYCRCRADAQRRVGRVNSGYRA